MADAGSPAGRILSERFGRDRLIALATSRDNTPFVRTVNAWYEDGAFYVITHARSGKMLQLAENPTCAIAGEWFTAQGVGQSLGPFAAPENAPLARRLRAVFTEWIDNGHNDLASPQCVILKIALTRAVLFSHGTRYDPGFA